MRFTLLPVLSLLTLTLAAPTTLLVARQQATQCGDNYYSADAVNNAFQQGYYDYENGEQYGYDNYPHQYNNYEGFNFPVSGPYQEFPILADGNTYDGGSPGPDRVVFNENGQYAGAITHTGASGNGFVGCSGTS